MLYSCMGVGVTARGDALGGTGTRGTAWGGHAAPCQGQGFAIKGNGQLL